MLAEITNPSDPYTIEGEWPVICAATLILGEGKYGLDEYGGERSMPIFLIGGEPLVTAWTQEQFGKSFAELFESTRADIPSALDSVVIGKPSQREFYNDAVAAIDDPAKREAFKEKWHDRKRSSMNDIGGRARRIAATLRKKAEKESVGA